MMRFLIKRILYIGPVALCVSILCFLLLHIAPGDPLFSVLPPDAPPTLVAMLRAEYGFDQPLVIQFLKWINRALHGDLGLSISTARPVLMEIGRGLLYTVPLASLAAIIGFPVGLALGIYAGTHFRTPGDRLATGLGVLGVSIPNYWFGIVLVAIFSIRLDWLPALGAGEGFGTSSFFSHLILPALALAIVPMGMIVRTTRAAMVEILERPFIEMLKAKGMPDRVITLHAVKNAAPTLMAVVGVQFGYLLAGSILVETVFAWPGTGQLMLSAILSRDIPLLQGLVLVLAMIFVLLNLLVDIFQIFINPQIRKS